LPDDPSNASLHEQWKEQENRGVANVSNKENNAACVTFANSLVGMLTECKFIIFLCLLHAHATTTQS
jgi:hypothetical protein